MRNVIKQICLYLTVVTLIMLFQKFPETFVTFIDEHWNLVGVISTIAWIVYCACDNHKN